MVDSPISYSYGIYKCLDPPSTLFLSRSTHYWGPYTPVEGRRRLLVSYVTMGHHAVPVMGREWEWKLLGLGSSPGWVLRASRV